MKILLAAIAPLIIFSLDSAFAESEQEKKSIFDLLTNAPEELLSELDIPETSAGDELKPELTITPTSCKEGLNLVIKASDKSPACVKPTSIYKLIERNWMFVREAFAQSDDVEQPETTSDDFSSTDLIPSDSERAMFFTARASGGLLQKEIVTNFHKFTPFTSEEPQIKPDNPTDLKSTYKFALESLPSKDKLEFYRLVGNVISGSGFADEPFDVNVDVKTGDGTVIQTWAYRDCTIDNYVTYLQDTVFFFQFSNEQAPEIRERAIVECRGFDLEVPEN